MRSKTLVISLSCIVVLLGTVGAGLAYDGGSTLGCPEQYYHPEYGCQVAPDFEYVPEEKTVEVASVRGCPVEYFTPEFGCQIAPEVEYVEEYALVKEELPEEKAVRGCPIEYYNSEFGCQLFNVDMNP